MTSAVKKSGRPIGAKDRQIRVTAARKLAEMAAAEGITPLDMMLTIMREMYSKASVLPDGDERTAALMAAVEVAHKAAPYCHARLANVQMQADLRINPQDATDEQLAAIAFAGADVEEDGHGVH